MMAATEHLLLMWGRVSFFIFNVISIVDHLRSGDTDQNGDRDELLSQKSYNFGKKFKSLFNMTALKNKTMVS